MLDEFKEECAVVGVIGDKEAANFCYLGLYAMQHRGQEGAGIVSVSEGEVSAHRGEGLVADIFSEKEIESLVGDAAVGHARYGTHGLSDSQNIQPFVAKTASSSFALAHNGNIVNADSLRAELEKTGSVFSSSSDSEVILHLIAREAKKDSLKDKVLSAVSGLKGAFSLAILSDDCLIAVRDPAGVRPLALGKIADGYVVASETCAFDLIGAEFVRDVEPGEVLEIRRGGKLSSEKIKGGDRKAFCIFEYVYFSRPDSTVNGKNVYAVRRAMGVELAKEHPANADIVVPVPDSAWPAAIGYAQETSMPIELGLIRNHYVGRTFIEPKQSIRDFGVKVKLNAIKDFISGKRVVVVDDSIVRGTTCKKIIAMIRQSGASEVHVRVSSPPTTGPCYYGIDTPSKEELIASNSSVDDIREYIGADTLGYLSIDGLYRATTDARSNYCDACFSGEYLLGTPE